MRVWAVTMVRDELDIIPYTIAHLLTEDLDGIIVTDNMSVDGTWEWLNDTAAAEPTLHVSRDPEIGYYQSRKMTALAHEAFAAGADWVIPFDADELWHNPNRRHTLGHTIRHTPTYGRGLLVKLYNHYPTSSDDPAEPNPYLRIVNRDPTPAPLHKIIVSRDDNVVIAQGNHDATGTDPYRKIDTAIEIAHFPWRSAAQFVRKVANGHQAYQATDLPEDQGTHWRNYGELLEKRGEVAIEALFNDWFCDPPFPLQPARPPWAVHKK